MLGFLKPKGELVELKGRQVVFLTTKTYQRDAQFSIKLSLPAPNTQKLELDVRVLRQRPAPDNKYITIAVVETPKDYPELHGFPTRDSRREERRLTLQSGDLPGYRAVTTDLSHGGFKSELEAELVEGDCIKVTFEFEQLNGLKVDLLAEIRWVQKKGNRFVTGFSFPEQGQYQEGYKWLCDWLSTEGDTEVKRLFKPARFQKVPPIPENLMPREEPPDDPLEELNKNLELRIPFKGFLRGWAWEQGDDLVVVVLEDDDGRDHWIEFPGCRGLHARCRDRKIRLQGVGLVFRSEMIKEYSRTVTMESLYHFQFLDDYARVCLDVVAAGCREQMPK